MNNLIKVARHIPVNNATQIISVSPVTLPAPDRAIPLELRITAPATGSALPIILLSHGHGPSLYIPSKDTYGPLVNFYAEHGFAVIQPTHLNSRVAGAPEGTPGGPLYWRSRIRDFNLILDKLDEIEASTPLMAGRFDKTKVAAVGHSMGGQTVSMLLGASLTDPNDETARDVNVLEPRIKAGVLLGAPGNGGDGMAASFVEKFSFMNMDFSRMATQTLVVAGDADASTYATTRGPAWHMDPYHCGAGRKSLLTLFGGGHGFGGVAGWDAKETDDEDPDRLGTVQRMTWAYLRSALYDGDGAWGDACKALQAEASSQGKVEEK